MNDLQRGWLAGMLEGEGYFALSDKIAQIAVSSVDLDVIQSLQEVTGMGNINGPYRHKKSNHQPYYNWRLARREEVKYVLESILPLLHARRKTKAQELLDFVNAKLDQRGLPTGVIKYKGSYRAKYKKHLGTFPTIEEAKEAYESARLKEKLDV